MQRKRVGQKELQKLLRKFSDSVILDAGESSNYEHELASRAP